MTDADNYIACTDQYQESMRKINQRRIELDNLACESQYRTRRRAEAYQIFCAIVSAEIAKDGFVSGTEVKGIVSQAYAYRDLFSEYSPREITQEAAPVVQPPAS